MSSTKPPHLFMASSDPDDKGCTVCGLPEGNRAHSARPVVADKRRRVLRYKKGT